MGIIGGVLNLVSSIASTASTHGGDAPKAEAKGNGESIELDAGPLKVSINDNGLSVKLDGKEIAKIGDPEGSDDDDEKPAAKSKPELDLHSKDTFEEPKAKPKVALLDAVSGIGSKPGGVGDGRA